MSSDKYILLNCENAKKLIRYTTSINNYLFYDDYTTFKKNKDKIKKNFIKSLIEFISKQAVKDIAGTNVGKLVGSLIQKGGIPNLSKLSKLSKSANLSKLSKSAKSSKLSKLSKSAKSSKSSLFNISKPCEFIAEMQSGKIDSSLITKKIKDVGIHIQKFGTTQKLESFKFIGYILSDEKMMETNGKAIIIKSMCNDPFLTFEACVLRKPDAIVRLSVTGIEKTIEQIDEIIAKKYPDVKKMFDDKKITFKKNKIKAKYISNNVKKDASIVKFNLVDKNISIKLQKQKDIIEIMKDNVAFTKLDENYKKINIDDINEYLITNIDDTLISKCAKK